MTDKEEIKDTNVQKSEHSNSKRKTIVLCYQKEPRSRFPALITQRKHLTDGSTIKDVEAPVGYVNSTANRLGVDVSSFISYCLYLFCTMDINMVRHLIYPYYAFFKDKLFKNCDQLSQPGYLIYTSENDAEPTGIIRSGKKSRNFKESDAYKYCLQTRDISFKPELYDNFRKRCKDLSQKADSADSSDFDWFQYHFCGEDLTERRSKQKSTDNLLIMAILCFMKEFHVFRFFRSPRDELKYKQVLNSFKFSSKDNLILFNLENVRILIPNFAKPVQRIGQTKSDYQSMLRDWEKKIKSPESYPGSKKWETCLSDDYVKMFRPY